MSVQKRRFRARPLASFILYYAARSSLHRSFVSHASSFFSFPISFVSLLSSFLHRLHPCYSIFILLSRSRYLNCPSAEIFSRIANLWTSPSMDRTNDVLVYLYRYVRPRTGTKFNARKRDKDKGTRIDEKIQRENERKRGRWEGNGNVIVDPSLRESFR